MVARQHAATRICQHCGNSPAVIRCSDCRPHPFLCGQCDVRVHRGQVFHNRDSMTHAFFHPLPPTTCVVERVLNQCERLVPLEMPETICGCLRVSSSVIAGQSIVVVTMNGRYDLRLPQIRCKACEATWSPGVDDLIRNDYWPATSHYSTVYATDVLFSFEELKMAAPVCLKMSGLGFDAEDLELEEELQDVNRVLGVLESQAQKELKAQREHNPTPVQLKKRDMHGFVIPKRPSSSRKTSGMSSAPTTKQHQQDLKLKCFVRSFLSCLRME
ncbi:uncharacterized protein LOC143698740 [Siphateles boraxobius]|uniref:uncharacterized protein LOC143698740 n=1 Tax=Siphateles boraxobius TaxID=180520 RepID=UPI00406313DC